MSSYSVAAIKATMGSTSYFQTVMRASELVQSVKAAMDFPEFETFMAHEKMQRPISEERVEREIVPYLTNSPDIKFIVYYCKFSSQCQLDYCKILERI